MSKSARSASVLSCVLGVLVLTAGSLAVRAEPRDRDQRGGEVLPAEARPHGFSLEDAAEATAVYNTGIQANNPATPPPPNVPFGIIVGNATVKPGTVLYVPIFVSDDSGGTQAGFPKHIADEDADADFLDSLVLNQFGVEAFIVQVDGQTTVLDDDYVTGTKTAPLLDGTPAGTHYIVSAAFLTPLSRGNHTVTIGGIVAGTPIPFLTYDVTVR